MDDGWGCGKLEEGCEDIFEESAWLTSLEGVFKDDDPRCSFWQNLLQCFGVPRSEEADRDDADSIECGRNRVEDCTKRSSKGDEDHFG